MDAWSRLELELMKTLSKQSPVMDSSEEEEEEEEEGDGKRGSHRQEISEGETLEG